MFSIKTEILRKLRSLSSRKRNLNSWKTWEPHSCGCSWGARSTCELQDFCGVSSSPGSLTLNPLTHGLLHFVSITPKAHVLTAADTIQCMKSLPEDVQSLGSTPGCRHCFKYSAWIPRKIHERIKLNITSTSILKANLFFRGLLI